MTRNETNKKRNKVPKFVYVPAFPHRRLPFDEYATSCQESKANFRISGRKWCRCCPCEGEFHIGNRVVASRRVVASWDHCNGYGTDCCYVPSQTHGIIKGGPDNNGDHYVKFEGFVRPVWVKADTLAQADTLAPTETCICQLEVHGCQDGIVTISCTSMGGELWCTVHIVMEDTVADLRERISELLPVRCSPRALALLLNGTVLHEDHTLVAVLLAPSSGDAAPKR